MVIFQSSSPPVFCDMASRHLHRVDGSGDFVSEKPDIKGHIAGTDIRELLSVYGIIERDVFDFVMVVVKLDRSQHVVPILLFKLSPVFRRAG